MIGYAGSTKVASVYEGSQSLRDLFYKNAELFVYSWNPKTKLPSVDFIRTKDCLDLDTVDVTFDSGLVVTCTPDTPFSSFRGEPVLAGDIAVGQSIRAFSSSVHRDGHLRIHGWSNGVARHQYVARVIWEYFNGPVPDGMVIHHRDMVELNNNLDNLQLVTVREHNQIHYPGRVAKGFYKRNHKVISVEPSTAEVYSVEGKTHGTFVIADPTPVSGNCSGIVAGSYYYV